VEEEAKGKEKRCAVGRPITRKAVTAILLLPLAACAAMQEKPVEARFRQKL